MSVVIDPRSALAVAPLEEFNPGVVPERPTLRLVEAAPRKQIRVGLWSTLSLVAIFAGLLALAAMHSLVVQAQFELEHVQQQVSETKGLIEAQRVELARLEAPVAVTSAARDLGMIEPEERLYLATGK